jgi:Mrp family chromosome partitioning ATPase
MREVGSPQTIVVTSPGKKEGKTSCAINLAMAFAEHRKGRVLLVEANLREPGLAAALGFVTPSCFARQMAAHRANPLAPWEMVAAFFPNLHVLAVDPSANGQWLINGPAFKTAMDQLRSSGYEQIVVDCPPALGSADVNVIEDSADAVLLTAIAGKTKGESIRKAARQLSPANIVGVVLIDS